MAAENTIEPDMLATSISKLPPPTMQMKSPIEAVPSYEALMHEVYPDQQQQPNQAQPAYQQPVHQQYDSQQPQQHNVTYHSQIQQQRQPSSADRVYDQEYVPQTYYAKPRRPHGKTTLSTDIFKSKKMWVLASFIFALVLWGIPKVKTLLPGVVSPLDGRLTLPGLAGVSVVTALSYTIFSEFI